MSDAPGVTLSDPPSFHRKRPDRPAPRFTLLDTDSMCTPPRPCVLRPAARGWVMLLLLASLSLGGCHALSPTATEVERRVEFATRATTYTAGAEAALVLRNRSRGRVGHNLCFAELQVRSGDGWRRAPEAGGRFCTTIQFVLPPGDSSTFANPLPAALPAGKYRFVTPVEFTPTGERIDLATPAFTVVR
jgi:hypothetical protein